MCQRAEHPLRLGLDSLALSFQHTHTQTHVLLYLSGVMWSLFIDTLCLGCLTSNLSHNLLFHLFSYFNVTGVLDSWPQYYYSTILVMALAMFIPTVTSVCCLHYSHHDDTLFHLYHTTVILCESVNHQPGEKTVMIWHTYTKQQALHAHSVRVCVHVCVCGGLWMWPSSEGRMTLI